MIELQDLRFFVERKSSSYSFIGDLMETNEYKRRTANNMQDILKLVDVKRDLTLFSSLNVQTVANHPLMKISDTVKEGYFGIKCFVEQRGFNTEVHGIINAEDLNEQKIDQYSMQMDNGQYIGRWLIHSCYYAPLKKDTKAYSGGCFIMSTDDIQRLNYKLHALECVKPGSIINGELKEV